MFFLAAACMTSTACQMVCKVTIWLLGVVPRLAEGSDTQSMDPPLNLPQVS